MIPLISNLSKAKATATTMVVDMAAAVADMTPGEEEAVDMAAVVDMTPGGEEAVAGAAVDIEEVVAADRGTTRETPLETTPTWTWVPSRI